jgi:ElaB/YqjD/DUF883 family membrane-anchored ribosome-binding protein
MNNETKSKTITLSELDLSLLLAQCEELLGYVAEQTDGVATAREKRGAKRLRKRAHRGVCLKIARRHLQDIHRILEDQA